MSWYILFSVVIISKHTPPFVVVTYLQTPPSKTDFCIELCYTDFRGTEDWISADECPLHLFAPLHVVVRMIKDTRIAMQKSSTI